MISSKILFCLVLYFLGVTTDAYNVEDDFKQAIQKLSQDIGDAIDNALKVLEQLDKDVKGVAAMDIYGMTLVLDREEKSVMGQLDEIENENNKICVDKSRESLKEIRANLMAETEDMLKPHFEEADIVAEKSKSNVRAHLNVRDEFVLDFNACSDDECRRKTTDSVLDEILVTPERVAKLLKDSERPLWELIYKFEYYVGSQVDKYREQSIIILDDAKKCEQ